LAEDRHLGPLERSRVQPLAARPVHLFRVENHRPLSQLSWDRREECYGRRETTVKITIQTMSTKCQYRPAISMKSACSELSRPVQDTAVMYSSQKIPIVTCAPWKPVSVNSEEPNRLCCNVSSLL